MGSCFLSVLPLLENAKLFTSLYLLSGVLDWGGEIAGFFAGQKSPFFCACFDIAVDGSSSVISRYISVISCRAMAFSLSIATRRNTMTRSFHDACGASLK